MHIGSAPVGCNIVHKSVSLPLADGEHFITKEKRVNTDFPDADDEFTITVRRDRDHGPSRFSG